MLAKRTELQALSEGEGEGHACENDALIYNMPVSFLAVISDSLALFIVSGTLDLRRGLEDGCVVSFYKCPRKHHASHTA